MSLTDLAVRARSVQNDWAALGEVLRVPITKICASKTLTDYFLLEDLRQEVLEALPRMCAHVLEGMSDDETRKTLLSQVRSLADSKIYQLREGPGRETRRRYRNRGEVCAARAEVEDIEAFGQWGDAESLLDQRRRLSAALEAAPSLKEAASDRFLLREARLRWGNDLVDLLCEAVV